jgi:heat shock protein HslJ
VPKTININERCSTCDKVQGIHNMIWSCEDCNFPSDATKSISIVFNNSSDVLSFSGLCNNGSGTYTYSSITGVIKVTDLATTLIGCKYVEWETYTVQNMYHASSYKINGNNLVIYSNSEYNLYFTKN